MFQGQFKLILEDVFNKTSITTSNKLDATLAGSGVVQPIVPAPDSVSTWLWNTNDILTKSDEIIAFLVAKNVDNVYLQINYGISAPAYEAFIQKASDNNIRVHALDGGPTWISDATEVSNFFTWVSNYQAGASASEKFQTIHLDVEPHALDTWNTDRANVVDQFQTFVTSAVAQSHAQGLEIAFDIPVWFDTINYTNSRGTGVLYDWMLTTGLNEIAVMSFRDLGVGVVADGSEGIYDVAKYELDKAQTLGIKVSLGVETQDLGAEPQWLTFNQEGEAYMYQQLGFAKAAVSPYSVFDGFAIHYYDSWKNMTP